MRRPELAIDHDPPPGHLGAVGGETPEFHHIVRVRRDPHRPIPPKVVASRGDEIRSPPRPLPSSDRGFFISSLAFHRGAR
jgi:hypothetical protein